jgi:TonB family protein
MLRKILLLPLLILLLSFAERKKNPCSTAKSKEQYQKAVAYYDEAKYAEAKKCLDICLKCSQMDVDARLLRIQINKKLNYTGPACEDLNVLRSYGVPEADTVVLNNCKDNIRWWKELPAPSMANDSLRAVDNTDAIPVADSVQIKEENPTYPGGEAAMIKDLYSRISYPEDCRENNIMGKVVVEFVVEKDGRISNIELANRIPNGRSLEMAAYKAVLGLKSFSPAKINDKPVRVKMRLPVIFKLQ